MPRKKKEITEEKKEESIEEKKKELEIVKEEIKEIGIESKDVKEEAKEKAKVKDLDINSIKSRTKEIEEIIVKLANEGMTASKIGMVLRDTHGIPSLRILDKKIWKVLASKGLKKAVPEELNNLIDKAEKLKKHLEKNKQDETARRGLQMTISKILRISEYMRQKGTLSKDWHY